MKDYMFDDTDHDHNNHEYLLSNSSIFDIYPIEHELENNLSNNNLLVAIEQNKKDNPNKYSGPVDAFSSIAAKDFCINQKPTSMLFSDTIYKPQYTCKYDFCEKLFTNISHCNQHITLDHPNKIFTIEKDKHKYFESNDEFNVITAKNDESNQKSERKLRSGTIYAPQYICTYDFCDKTFTHISYRNQHMKEVHIKKIFAIEKTQRQLYFIG